MKKQVVVIGLLVSLVTTMLVIHLCGCCKTERKYEDANVLNENLKGQLNKERETSKQIAELQKQIDAGLPSDAATGFSGLNMPDEKKIQDNFSSSQIINGYAYRPANPNQPQSQAKRSIGRPNDSSVSGGIGGNGNKRAKGVKRSTWGNDSDILGQMVHDRAEISKDESSSNVPVEEILANISADEIWVIAKLKNENENASISNEEQAGCGALMAKRANEEIALPLKHTEVKGQISGYIAEVDVEQQFHNPYNEKIEAEYVFPLPHNAAINEFIMTIGHRKIRGIIREKEEAERIYQEARNQGYVASLLTEQRPNIFTQKVANIEPGKEIDINIKFFDTLEYADGWYEFVFPMVVGPRYNPAGFSDGVGAVGMGKKGISGQATEVQYLKPGQRSGHDIGITVDIDAGVKIEEVTCKSHVIKQEKICENDLRVKLSEMDSIANKDFVLRFRVAGDKLKSSLVTSKDERGKYFTLMVYPPANLSSLKRAPMEMIFVLDCSESMSGKPLELAKKAISRALMELKSDDTFQVIEFSNNASQLGEQPIAATGENIRKGLEYVEKINGGGGTEMMTGIKAALDFDHDPKRLRIVSFMTDGYIGNEGQILAAIHEKLGESRIFSFGVGSSTNRYLLDGMAKIGKGAVAYVGLNDSAVDAVDAFYKCISHPALTDVKIDWGKMEVSDVYPRRMADLFVGRPIIVTGKFKGDSQTEIKISGKAGKFEQEYKIAFEPGKKAAKHEGISFVWARKKIEHMANMALYDNGSDWAKKIKKTALEYGLMSEYTAFVAVDSSRKTEGNHGVSVSVPVPMPEGVRYETTVRE